ncbi:TetR/AcrR family transcriptional regulator [Hyunsoonleella pacifica]|uniref:TetR/AcrR family transcriptional regulator n=1 Tax=Hyunsoonleella pacifica TaxID=1080224 RepID=A0A4Q9FQS3_9FLAO|nr:TetR/AcrR family transcriptional regulator [Hyunsoonleella pacifica]TBN17720.1 TetR/AcrR family transcriptional regulator [Hyunsoonleella pacifica]
MKRSFQIDMPKVETFDKNLVIKQATEVFHDKGYNATSMQDLVDATGLNRSSIYNSFENKHNLFLECLNSYQEFYKEQLNDKLLKASNALEAIDNLFELYLNDIIKEKNNKGCLIVNCKSEMANHDKPITQFLVNNQNLMIDILEDIVDRGQNELLINKKMTAKAYALYLYSSIQGFRMTSILTNNKQELQSIIKTIKQTLI